MRDAEARAIAAGVSSKALMEAAGAKVAEVAMRAWTRRPVAVVCGPGNNGGDGFVAARRFAEAGWPVKALLVGDRDKLRGDAKLMADIHEGEIAAFSPGGLESAGLIVDALFGTGLDRDVEGRARIAIEAANDHPAPVLAVDLPSGINADTGAVMGVAIKAARTVTFFKKKPGHALFPGRAYGGAVDIVDIGVTAEAVAEMRPDTFENHPALWGRAFRRPAWNAHKYARGHVFAVSGGPANTGAARLAAMGALRIGAGLVTVLSPEDALAANAAHLTAIMLRKADSAGEIAESLQGADKYVRIALIGPAAGVGEATRDKTLAILNTDARAVIDADALTSFKSEPQFLFRALRANDVLTPHTGEFERLFGEIGAEGKLAAARAAATKAGSIIVLKGADTVIASPDGRAVINVNAPPELATAGAGDVLAGFIAGLSAQGMPGFEAACAGVWMHGAAAQIAGPGLIAEDLPAAAPAVFRSLLSPPKPQEADQADG